MGALSDELNQVTGDEGGVVTRDAGLFQVVAENGDHTQGFNGFEVGNDLACALEGIFGFELIGNGSAIDQREVEELPVSVAVQGADMVGGGEAQTLIGLSHQVADVNLGGRRGDDGIGYATDEKVGNEAGEQGSGTDADDIGVGNGIERLGQRLDVGGDEEELLDANFAGGDIGLAADAGAVFHQCFQFDVGGGGRMNVATGKQDFGRQANRFGEIVGDRSESSEKEIAEAVPFEAGAFLETMLKKL